MVLMTWGAGLYWASMMANVVLPAGSAVGAMGQSIAAVAVTLVALVVAPYIGRRALRGCSVAALVCSAVSLVLSGVELATGWSPAPVLTVVASMGSPLLMLMWGARFASESRVEAFGVVARTVVVAVGFCCVALALRADPSAPWGAALPLMRPLLETVSAVLLLVASMRCPVRVVARDFARGARWPFARFVASRVLLGLLMGALIATTQASRGGWPAALAVAGAVGCAALGALRCVRGELPALLPLVPLAVGAGLPILVLSNEAAAERLLYSCVWFSWIVMSSVQLSELKYVFGMSELALAFSEKAVIVTSMTVGRIAGPQLSAACADHALAIAPGLAPALVLAACAYASATLLRLSAMRGRESVVREVVESVDDRLGYIYGLVASEHGLSEREGQILPYLAMGHTRAYISNALGIAPGTVKSHIGRIYQKTACHTKEEIIALVNEKKRFSE